MKKTEADLLKNAINYAIKYLSYKDRTEKEVRDKLLSCGEFESDTVSLTIERLKELNYIDDRKYAELYAASKSSSSMDGKQKIKQKLLLRGINANTADAAVAALELSGALDEPANVEKLIRKKARNTNLDGQFLFDRRERSRIYSYLARKGYSFSAIDEGFRRLGCEHNAYYEEDNEACDEVFDKTDNETDCYGWE